MSENTKPSTDGSNELKKVEVKEVDNIDNLKDLRVTCHALTIGFKDKQKSKGSHLDKVENSKQTIFDESVIKECMVVSLKDGNVEKVAATKKVPKRKKEPEKQAGEEK